MSTVLLESPLSDTLVASCCFGPAEIGLGVSLLLSFKHSECVSAEVLLGTSLLRLLLSDESS